MLEFAVFCYRLVRRATIAAKIPPPVSGNTFIYGDLTSKIESVVYSVEDKVYTFYFSPTAGLVDVDAMLLADDYVKIVTATPTGEFDLLSSNNRLLYKKIDIAAGAEVEQAAMSLQLTSVTTAKMSFNVVTKSGEKLRAEYNGTCIRQGEAQQTDYDVELTSQVFGYYMGQPKKATTNEYQIALTNASWSGSGTSFSLTSEGYALVLDFYGTPGTTWRELPTGTFTESQSFAAHTFYNDYSGVIYRDASGNQTVLQLVDPVCISRDAAGQTTITAVFLDSSYNEHTLAYVGDLKMSNATLKVSMPQMERDVVFEGAYASGIYEGDVLDNGNGLTEITINDWATENNEPGYVVKLSLFNEKFLDPKRECRLIPGTYTAATTNKQWTWMQPYEVNFMGMIVPLGTYALYYDGKTDEYAYATSGDIVIRQGTSKNNFTIEFELQTLAGHTLRGSYSGDIYIEDQSNDDDNDGSSNLTADYELNLDHHKRANCTQPETIWIRGLDNITIPECCAYSGREYGFQHIQIGTSQGTWEPSDEYPETGKLVEGDIMNYDLLVTKGTENQLTPGVYPITTNRYPILFYAGVCVRGYSRYYGTSMGRVNGVIGWGKPTGYYDPDYMVDNGWLNVPTVNVFASIYTGSVTVEKAVGGDNWFTISVDGRDVLKHHITGSWTGPVYIGTSDTPVLDSGIRTETATTQRRTTPTASQFKKELAARESVYVNRKSFK